MSTILIVKLTLEGVAQAFCHLALPIMQLLHFYYQAVYLPAFCVLEID